MASIFYLAVILFPWLSINLLHIINVCLALVIVRAHQATALA
jgi:hypothetical protein